MKKQSLQYSTLVYGLSITGFICCCFAGFGALPSGIAYYIANSELKKFYANPEMYSNQDNLYTGKIVSLVVFIINILYLGITIYNIYTMGWDNLLEQSRQMMEAQ